MQFASIFLVCNFISVYTTAVAVQVSAYFVLQVWTPVKGKHEQYESVGYVKFDQTGALRLGYSADASSFHLENKQLRLVESEKLVGAGNDGNLRLEGERKFQWTTSKKVLHNGQDSTIILPDSGLEIRGCFQGKTSLDMPFYLKPNNDHTRCSIQFFFEQM